VVGGGGEPYQNLSGGLIRHYSHGPIGRQKYGTIGPMGEEERLVYTHDRQCVYCSGRGH
jgi:hypothetical protein